MIEDDLLTPFVEGYCSLTFQVTMLCDKELEAELSRVDKQVLVYSDLFGYHHKTDQSLTKGKGT